VSAGGGNLPLETRGANSDIRKPAEARSGNA